MEQPTIPHHGERFELSTMMDRVQSRHVVENGWTFPLSWDQELRFPPVFYEIKLDIDYYDITGEHLRSRRAQVENFFDPLLRNGVPVSRVLLRGDAGFGKSTLCLKILNDWSQKKTTFNARPCDRIIPVLFKLRFLKPDEDLEKQLLSHIQEMYAQEVESEYVLHFLKAIGSNLLLILDGYDELDEEGRSKVKDFLSWERTSIFKESSILVTTRPLSDISFKKFFNKHYTLREISGNRVERVVATFDKSWPCPFTSHGAGNQVFSVWHFVKRLFGGSSEYRTRLMEHIIEKESGEKVHLKGLPPLVVSLICWIIRQPDFTYKDKDIIFNCIFHLSKRCNFKEEFGFSDEKIEEILWFFGVLISVNRRTWMKKYNPHQIFEQDELNLLTLTGVLKSSGTEKEWQPIYKTFAETLAKRASEITLRCSPEEQIQWISKYSSYISRYIPTLEFQFSAGRLQKMFSNLFWPKMVIYDFETKQLAFCTRPLDTTNCAPTVLTILCEFQEDVNEFSDNSCQCPLCLRISQLTLMCKSFCKVVYKNADANMETLEGMLCTHPQSVLTRCLESCRYIWLDISTGEEFVIRQICINVLQNLFGVPNSNTSAIETQSSFFEYVMHQMRPLRFTKTVIRKSFLNGHEQELTTEQTEQDTKENNQVTEYNWNDIRSIKMEFFTS